MTCLASARLVFLDSLATPVSRYLRFPRSSPRSLYSLFSTTTNGWPLRRTFSTAADASNELFNYTSGRWIFNDALRHKERRRVFNVNGLSRLAAESTNHSPDDVVSFEKLAEGGFNRTFLITMRDNFQLVARIPYPIMIPKPLAIASEVATMDFLRSSGLPIPKVYGYSPTSDNVAETEYIFMEFVNGTKLNDIWFDLGEQEIESLMRQIVGLEAKMMSMAFPAGGSLYYAQDLERVSGKPGIPLKDERFCIGPDVRLPLWLGKRSLLNVDRGPYKNVESTLVGPANKELAFLQQFGQPLLPFHRVKRESYQYQEQPPSDHIENLQRYLRMASSLVPKDLSLNHFCIRHPDLREANIIVSKSSDSGLQVVSVLDWQHASILPAFLLASIPQRLQFHDDYGSQRMTPEVAQSYAKELRCRRLLQDHYVKSTVECNEVHRAVLADPLNELRRHLFMQAGEPWLGETIMLKLCLIDATKNWEKLTEGGAPCPVVLDDEDIRKTMELADALRDANDNLQMGVNVIGVDLQGLGPAEDHEVAMERSKNIKELILSNASSLDERGQIEAHWPLDDMDEEKYM